MRFFDREIVFTEARRNYRAHHKVPQDNLNYSNMKIAAKFVLNMSRRVRPKGPISIFIHMLMDIILVRWQQNWGLKAK